MVMSAGLPVGPAALITPDGYFVASLASIGQGEIVLRLPSGENITVQRISEDKMSQTVLLKATGKTFGIPVGGEPDFSRTGPPLFAISSEGIVKVDLVSSHKLGLAGPARRMVPMCEIRFAGSPSQMRTALFFQGRTLIGPMLTALGSVETKSDLPRLASPALGLAQDYGPDPMSVGFVPGPDVMVRVLDGFRSPSRHVSHPYLGVLCKDAIGIGAQVVKVVGGSSAERVGIRPGDVIIGIGNSTIRDHVDFAQAMFRQRVGERVTLLMKRGMQTVVAMAIVGDGSED
jgi:S1-C subfamily serine protease